MKYVFWAVVAALCVMLGSCFSFPSAQDVTKEARQDASLGSADELRRLSIDELTVRIEKEPQNDTLYRMRAMKYADAGQFSEAERDSTRAIEINPGNFENWGTRGELYFAMGWFEKSESDFMHVLEISPGTRYAYRGLFRCFFEMREFAKALVCANKLVEIEPENYATYIDRGVTRGAAQDRTGAMADLDKAIELNPQSVLAFTVRGSMYIIILGEYEKALADFDAAIRLNADYADAWSGRAAVHYYFKNYQKSIEDATTCISLVSKPDWRIVENRGNAYAALAAQTEDEKVKAEYLEKAEADFAWARELGREQQSGILE
jgi:tetratricopeptide (TPR) repeat protein